MREINQPEREAYSRACQFASSAPAAILAGLLSLIDQALTPAQLDEAALAVSRALSEETIGETEAQQFYERIDGRRPKRAKWPAPFMESLGKHTPRAVSRFEPRKRSKSPDREASKARRRKFGGCGALPATLRQFYSEGQRAVLAIISLECRGHGACTLSVNEIGARAGAGHTLVQNTLREARRNGHIRVQERPRRGQKHLTNRVTITAPDWQAWNKKYVAKQGGSGFTFAKEVGPTKNNYIKKAGAVKSDSAELGNPIKAAVTAERPPSPTIGLGRREGTPLEDPRGASSASEVELRPNGGARIIPVGPPRPAHLDPPRVGGGRRIG